ncbi:lysozyme inhibitor LprI family protein [Leptolyngbya sp. Heron Island J]|uniref:lysozyme inhibitor LprI family protein n=1 Tax=Leptolyngbya sp. Heron Island J TaxID=1385935 RepID=UPI00040EBAD1|nr:lysozyme inhibitor LprI family protein [Leptolyngbya sp. Heron Island J]
MSKPTLNLFSLVLILGLVGCGQSPSVTAPEESAGTTPESTEVAPPETDAPESQATETPRTPSSASPSGTETPSASQPSSRSSPVALAKKDCGQLTTQQEMNQCAAENYAISDKALNQVYQEVRQGLDDAAKARLTAAEERWIVFRDAQCTFESDRFEGGSMAPLIQATCMEQITDNRIAELQQTVKTEIGLADIDAQLNEVYQNVQSLASEATGEALVDVQLSWLDYRDAHCEYEANLPAAPDVKACLAVTTETRVWQLEALEEEWSL